MENEIRINNIERKINSLEKKFKLLGVIAIISGLIEMVFFLTTEYLWILSLLGLLILAMGIYLIKTPKNEDSVCNKTNKTQQQYLPENDNYLRL